MGTNMADDTRAAQIVHPLDRLATDRLMEQALLLDVDAGAEGVVHKIGALLIGPGGIERECRREGRSTIVRGKHLSNGAER
jgi:hypothetical protein